jgi:hypothetical protein
VTLLRIPLGCLSWTILRLTILAVALIAGWLLVAKPLIEEGGDAVRPATHRLNRLSHCVEKADGNAHRIFRCSAKF